MASKIEEIKALNTVLLEIDKTIKQIGTSAAKMLEGNEVKATIESLKQVTAGLNDLKKSNDALNTNQKEQAKLNQKLTQLKSEEAKETAKLKVQISEVNKANQAEAKEKMGLVSQYQKLSKELRDNKNRYKELAIQNKQNTAEGRNLLKVIQEQDKKFKDIDKSVGDHHRTIGDYQGAVNSLFPSLNQINGTLTAMSRGVMTLGQGFRGLISTQDKAGKSSISLGKAMLTIPIFALVAAFTALVAAFGSTQRGADAMNKVIIPLKAVFGALLGVLQDVSFWLADKLGEAFKNPTKALKDFGQMILDNVLNRFKAFSVFMEAIVLFMNGQWAAGLKKGADAVLQLTTGVTNATDKVSNFVSATGDVINGAIEAGQRIDELRKAFEKLEIASTVPLQKLKLEFQELKEIANDQLKSDRERLAALDEAMEKQREISRIEGQLLQLRIERMEEEQGINDTKRKGDLELEKLRAQQLEFETTAQKKIAGLRSLASGIEKRAIMDRQKAQETDQKRRIELIENTYERELALLKLKHKKELEEAKKNGEDLYLLEEMQLRERIALQSKMQKEAINERRKLNTTAGDEAIARAKKEAERLAEIERQKREELKKTIDQVNQLSGTTLNALKAEADAKSKFLDREVADKQAALQRQEQLGVRNTAVEKRLLAEAQAERQKQLERQAQIDNAIRLKDAYFGFLQARIEKDPDSASIRALGDVAQAEALSKFIGALAGFKEGGYTGDVAVDKIAGVTHGKEFVIDAPTTAQLGLKGADMGDFRNKLFSGDIFKQKSSSNIADDRLLMEVQKLNKNIENKPTQLIDVDSVGNWVERLERSRYRETIVHQKRMRKW
jgi:hypothetical protein